MKRKYKLLIIILISSALTYIIFSFTKNDKINLVALGDGIASGETSYKVDGISFNDYLKEYFDNQNTLNSYNNNYAIKNNSIEELLNDLDSNEPDKDNLRIKQLLHKANVITIAIGEEEFVKAVMTGDLNLEYIKDFTSKYDRFLKNIKNITDAKIVIVGFYENEYLDKGNTIILNSEIANAAIKYDAIFINIKDLMVDDEYFSDNKKIYFNYKGHNKIAEMIIYSI